MVSEEYPRKVAKASRHPRAGVRDTLFNSTHTLYAGLPGPNAGHLRAGVTYRTGEWVEVDAQGVVLVRHGVRHVLYLWGTDPGVYLPH